MTGNGLGGWDENNEQQTTAKHEGLGSSVGNEMEAASAFRKSGATVQALRDTHATPERLLLARVLSEPNGEMTWHTADEGCRFGRAVELERALELIDMILGEIDNVRGRRSRR